MTDGSPATMTDLHQLNTTHPALLGAPARFKGTVDPGVSVGSATIHGEQSTDGLLAEAEWCALFPDDIETYLREPDQVTLEGMTKWGRSDCEEVPVDGLIGDGEVGIAVAERRRQITVECPRANLEQQVSAFGHPLHGLFSWQSVWPAGGSPATR